MGPGSGTACKEAWFVFAELGASVFVLGFRAVSIFGGSLVTGHRHLGHAGCARRSPCPGAARTAGGGRRGNPEVPSGPQPQHLLRKLLKGLLAQQCLRLTHAAPSHLLADSELTRKSCLVSLCFLRLPLGHLNSLCDLSVMRPAKPCFLPGPQADSNPHAVSEVL